MPEKLTLDVVKKAVTGRAAAFRCITEYQPAGGPGDKVFPPTYERGEYATETRILNGEVVDCVLLDSVQSQANRMELALLEAVRANRIQLPLLSVSFKDGRLRKPFTITSLEAPHRVADAIFRDSMLDGVIFRKSGKGRILDNADARNATGLLGLCPTALIFGVWDSTGPRGGLGTKFQRALVSEIVGWGCHQGVTTSSRIDPLQVRLDAGPLFERANKDDKAPHWTLDDKSASTEKNQPKRLGKDGKPSEAVHGNIPPQIINGGFTISRATQTTVLSLTAIRRLRFPLNGEVESKMKVDHAARTVLTALGLAAGVLAREEGADLRSRCQLLPTEEFLWYLLNVPGETSEAYTLDGDGAVNLLNQAVAEAKAAGLPWESNIALTPSGDLLELVCRSQELETYQTAAEGK